MSTETRAAERKPRHTEIQVHALSTADRRRPTVAAVTDIVLHTRGEVTEARGGASRPRLFREATQLKTVGTAVVCKAGIEPRDFEEEILSVNAPCGGRPTITVITDAVHVAPSILFT